MDLDIKLKPPPAGDVLHKSIVIPSPARQNRLPPIPSQSSSTDDHIDQLSGILLEQSKGDVEEAMKHLLSEAESAENRIQTAIGTLWQRMLDIIHQRSEEMEQRCASLKCELEESRKKVTRLMKQESALVQQTAKTNMQLSAEEKKRSKLEEQIAELKCSLDESKLALKTSSGDALVKEKSFLTDVENLRNQLQQKETMLKEYQSKIIKLTDRINRLSKDLSTEKTTSEKHQKSTSDLLSQQTSENRKLILEFSKLKGQLSSVNSVLAYKKEENDKLEVQLKTQADDNELTMMRIKKEHDTIVRELKSQISSLQNELDKIRLTYVSETENLKKQLVDAHKTLAEIAATTCTGEETGEDYIEARIKFLQHQNRKEIVKLNKQSSRKN